MSLLIAAGFLLPFAFKDSRMYIVKSFTVFRPISLLFFSAHSLVVILSDFIGESNTILAQISIVSAMAFTYFEIRFSRINYNKTEIYAQIIVLAVIFAILEIVRQNHPEIDFRFPIIALTLATYSSLIIYEVQVKKDLSFNKFKPFLTLLVLMFAASVVFRGYMGHHASGFTSVHDEGGVLLFARVLMVSSLVLIFLTLNNFYFESLWKGEFEVRQGTEAQFISTLTSLSKARDNETGNHTVRTKSYVRILAERLQQSPEFEAQIDSDYLEMIYDAAPLHDIGKIGIPDEILLKPGKLTAGEWKIMQTHATIGEEVLGTALDAEYRSKQQTLFLSIARDIAGCHHEKWDGSGYPRGLKGDEIPLAARLMSVADCYDALRSKRPYKEPWSHPEAMVELLNLKGTAFDPRVVDALVAEEGRCEEIFHKYGD
jgi:HD-GYP domain-containing protein (c-di-GMP phosphodiesterase class II)